MMYDNDNDNENDNIMKQWLVMSNEINDINNEEILVMKVIIMK